MFIGLAIGFLVGVALSFYGMWELQDRARRFNSNYRRWFDKNKATVSYKLSGFAGNIMLYSGVGMAIGFLVETVF